MLTKAYALAILERAVKTFAQSLAALLVADGTDLLTTNWGDRLSVAGMAAVVSVLTSVASGTFGQPGPSLGNAETLNPAAPEPAVAVPADGASANDFYEDDEPADHIMDAFESKPAGVTAPRTISTAQTHSQSFDGFGAPISHNPQAGE